MSAIHTGSIAIRLRADGLLEYSGTSEDHPVRGWETTDPAREAQVLIPTQRAGDAYKSVVIPSKEVAR